MNVWLSAACLPVLIFLAEMTVVTVGTVRIIAVSRGMKGLAPLLGFLEVAIWLFAIAQIMQNLNNVACFLAYASGFSVGNYVGIWIDEKLAMGSLEVHIITHRDVEPLVDRLKFADYGVTVMPARGSTGLVHVVWTVIPRKELARVKAIIAAFDPRAFYAVDGLQTATQGITPVERKGAMVIRMLHWRAEPRERCLIK